eukprot:6267155-Amphidinium_carterae.1
MAKQFPRTTMGKVWNFFKYREENAAYQYRSKVIHLMIVGHHVRCSGTEEKGVPDLHPVLPGEDQFGRHLKKESQICVYR